MQRDDPYVRGKEVVMNYRVDSPVTVQTVEADGESGTYAQLVLLIPQAEAEALAAARIERDGADLLAADAKPPAHAVADALISAGYGGAP